MLETLPAGSRRFDVRVVGGDFSGKLASDSAEVGPCTTHVKPDAGGEQLVAVLQRTGFHASSTFSKPATKRKGKGKSRGKCRHSTTATQVAKGKAGPDGHEGTATAHEVTWTHALDRFGRKHHHGMLLLELRIRLGRPKTRAPRKDCAEETPGGALEDGAASDARLQDVADGMRTGGITAACAPPPTTLAVTMKGTDVVDEAAVGSQGPTPAKCAGQCATDEGHPRDVDAGAVDAGDVDAEAMDGQGPTPDECADQCAADEDPRDVDGADDGSADARAKCAADAHEEGAAAESHADDVECAGGAGSAGRGRHPVHAPHDRQARRGRRRPAGHGDGVPARREPTSVAATPIAKGPGLMDVLTPSRREDCASNSPRGGNAVLD